MLTASQRLPNKALQHTAGHDGIPGFDGSIAPPLPSCVVRPIEASDVWLVPTKTPTATKQTAQAKDSCSRFNVPSRVRRLRSTDWAPN